MRYFICDGHYRTPMPVSREEFFRDLLPKHQAHLEEAIEKGDVLVAGPKTEDGGLIVLRAESREALDAFLARDPFVINGVVRFEVTEFDPKDRSSLVKDW